MFWKPVHQAYLNRYHFQKFITKFVKKKVILLKHVIKKIKNLIIYHNKLTKSIGEIKNSFDFYSTINIEACKVLFVKSGA